MSKIIKRYMVVTSVPHPVLEHLHGQLRLQQSSVNFRDVASFQKCPLSAKEAVRVEREDLSKYDSNYDLFLMKRLSIHCWVGTLHGSYAQHTHYLSLFQNRKGLKQRREEH